ncbi:MAG: hypothetical protein FWB91_14225 [Defluviitaleaceae bacterium]|nr:hypothetical protein [Defluviitaleaceae bacterium]
MMAVGYEEFDIPCETHWLLYFSEWMNMNFYVTAEPVAEFGFYRNVHLSVNREPGAAIGELRVLLADGWHRLGRIYLGDDEPSPIAKGLAFRDIHTEFGICPRCGESRSCITREPEVVTHHQHTVEMRENQRHVLFDTVMPVEGERVYLVEFPSGEEMYLTYRTAVAFFGQDFATAMVEAVADVTISPHGIEPFGIITATFVVGGAILRIRKIALVITRIGVLISPALPAQPITIVDGSWTLPTHILEFPAPSIEQVWPAPPIVVLTDDDIRRIINIIEADLTTTMSQPRTEQRGTYSLYLVRDPNVIRAGSGNPAAIAFNVRDVIYVGITRQTLDARRRQHNYNPLRVDWELELVESGIPTRVAALIKEQALISTFTTQLVNDYRARAPEKLNRAAEQRAIINLSLRLGIPREDLQRFRTFLERGPRP